MCKPPPHTNHFSGYKNEEPTWETAFLKIFFLGIRRKKIKRDTQPRGSRIVFLASVHTKNMFPCNGQFVAHSFLFIFIFSLSLVLMEDNHSSYEVAALIANMYWALHIHSRRTNLEGLVALDQLPKYAEHENIPNQIWTIKDQGSCVLMVFTNSFYIWCNLSSARWCHSKETLC